MDFLWKESKLAIDLMGGESSLPGSKKVLFDWYGGKKFGSRVMGA